MQVRLAQLQDADAISDLMKELGYAASGEMIKGKLCELGSGETDQVFVAETDGSLSGVVSCHLIPLFHQPGSLGRVTSFVVGEAFQGTGVGRALLAAAERYFLDSGCVRAEITSGLHRLGAHEFYKASGFDEGERRFVKAYS